VLITQCTPVNRGRFWVDRETTIRIRQLPMLASEEKG
jgi:hypothetical protein